MQSPERLKYNREALRQFDERSASSFEQAQDSAHARSHFQSSELKFDIIYEPDEHFTEFLLYVHEHTTEFTCHHSKFYWRSCAPCHRDSSQAKAYKEYYRNKVLKALGKL